MNANTDRSQVTASGILIPLLVMSTTTLAALAVAELVLRGLTAFPITAESNMEEHPLLLYTADPALADIDARGFRNPAPTAGPYDLVAIGDSHTYGSNARVDETWPARIAQATGLNVYNLGMGGYSVYQYDVLFDMALELEPATIVVAFYPANDWLPDCRLLALDAWVERTQRWGLQPPCTAAVDAPPSRSVRSLLLSTAIGSATHTLIWEPLRFRWLPRLGVGRVSSPRLQWFEIDGHRFSFGADRLVTHARATDLSRPATRAAYDDGLLLVRRWTTAANGRGIRLRFAVFPSKQRVLHEWSVAYGHAASPELDRLTRNERDAAARLLIDLESAGAPAVDVTPWVVAEFDEVLRDGRAMYPPGMDGHPYAPGYAAYAAGIATILNADD